MAVSKSTFSTGASVASLILGGILLLTSSLFLNDWRESQASDFCNLSVFADLCKRYDFFVIAASLGIIASILQIASAILAWKKQLVPFCALNAVICLSCVIAFALAIDAKATDAVEAAGDRAKAFIAFAAIDMIYSLAAAAGYFYFSNLE